MAFSLSGARIVCFSTADWDTLLPTNKHQLMKRLAQRGGRVLYIETLGTRAPRLSSGLDVQRIYRRMRRSFEGVRRREPRLYTLSPLVRPRWSTPLQIGVNQLAFRRQAASSLRRFCGAIAWVYSPYAVHLLDLFQPSAVVYHMVDDLRAVPGADRESLEDAELRLLSRADVVFCTEQSLYDRAQRTARRAYFMPNVADYGHFSKPSEPSGGSATRLAHLKTLPHPRVVFSGNLAPHKVDLALLQRLAKKRPEWSFVLIGPEWEGGDSSQALKGLRARRNVHFTGHVPYEDIPAFLHEGDVFLIPYLQNDATRAVFPLKFFEYFATGKPVVTSPLPSLYPFQGLARFAESAEQWLAAIEESFNEPPARIRQRKALARRNTWERRLAEMEKALGEVL